MNHKTLKTVIKHKHSDHSVSWMCKDTVMSLEKHVARNHLSQDAGSWPDIHCNGRWADRTLITQTHTLWEHTTKFYCVIFMSAWKEGNIPTCLTVMHPVENHLRCSVPACHNITCHFTLCLSCQAKIQNLGIYSNFYQSEAIVMIIAVSVLVAFATFQFQIKMDKR